MNLAADVVNQSLDAIGSEIVIGDLEEGTREAQVCLRAYGQCVRQLLRAAHWDFSRKQAPLTLLADATAQTPNVGTVVPTPWIYEYAYPIDCMKARFVPQNFCNPNGPAPPGNISIPTTPLLTGINEGPAYRARIVPARFLIATDFNYPVEAGTPTWDVQGVSPAGRTVVLTNVKHAQLVYTALMIYPSVWDSLFRAAMVAYLASEIALPLSKDKKFGMELRAQQINIAKDKIKQARITDGNEGAYSSDLVVDWMVTRGSGGSRWGGGGWGSPGGGPGVTGYGWDNCAFGDGSAY